MPYLRITCPDMPLDRRRIFAERLTAEINDLFFDPHAPVSREELRQRTAVHFTPYRKGDLFIGARAPDERSGADITVELSDWGMSARQQSAELPGFALRQWIISNIGFHPYPPKDFVVGGQLLFNRVPLIARVQVGRAAL